MDERETLAVQAAGIVATIPEREAVAYLIFRWDRMTDAPDRADYLMLADDLLRAQQVYRELAPVADILATAAGLGADTAATATEGTPT